MAGDLSTDLRRHDPPPRHQRLEKRVWLRMLSLQGEIFGRLNRALSAACGLSLAKFDVLAQLDRYPDGLSLGNLSQNLKVTGGNVSGLVQRLVADGFITREMSSTDRRSFVVRMTPEGKAVFDRACLAHQAELDTCFAAVPAEELDEALRVLNALSTHVLG